MQKVTYVLLQRHANSYWQTERDDDIRSGFYTNVEMKTRKEAYIL
jgi:hypothetical protein